MKLIKLIVILLAINSATLYSMNYRLVKLSQEEFSKLDISNFGIDKGEIVKEIDSVSFAADDFQISMLKSSNIKFVIAIDNFPQFLAKRAEQSIKILENTTFSAEAKFGSMGGFFTLGELYAEYDSLLAKYPEVSQKEVIGKTNEGRDIIAYRFGNFKTASPLGMPEVLFTSLHHAREPAGAHTLLFFIDHLLNKYSQNDPESAFLINNRSITVVPAVNPDGYEYNRFISPNGGGLWRKNRKKVNDSTYGVDLNRNYGPMELWDSKSGGSSTNPKLDTYRGSAPFSEPETKAIKDLCERSNFKIGVNYHTYGNLLVYPWGALSMDTPDSSLFRKFCFYATQQNKYVYGHDLQTLNYATQGNSDDWLYLASDVKNKILSFTPEVGNSVDYFWPKPERILPLCLENLLPNFQFLWSADYNFRVLNFDVEYVENNKASLKIEVANIGAGIPPKTNIMEVASLSSEVEVNDKTTYLTALLPGESVNLALEIEYKSGFTNGQYVGFAVTILQNGVSRKDTFFVRVFIPETMTIYDQGTSNWTLGYWGEEYDPETKRNLLTDSPNGRSSHGVDNFAYYDLPIDLTTHLAADLVFVSKWFVEQNYDAATVEISTDNGSTWLNLASSRMKEGLGINKTKQAKGKFYLEGNNFSLTNQVISLDSFYGKHVLLRFGVLADNATAYDGWSISSISINKYDPLASVAKLLPDFHKNHCVIVKNGECISVQLSEDANVSYALCNAEGKCINSGSSIGKYIELSSVGLPIGKYFLLINSNGRYSRVDCLVID